MLELRPYQRRAVDAIGEFFNTQDGNPLIVVPTAGGKSAILGTFIRESVEAWPETRILVLTHVRELIVQNFQEMVGIWPQVPAGIYSAGLRRRDIRAQVLFAGIQSIHRHAYALQRVDLVIVDEAHLIPRTSNTMYRRFLDELRQINPYIKIVGLTATPFRLDSGRLHVGDDAMFSDIAYEANIRELIDDGYLTPPVSTVAATQIDTSEVGVRGGEFIPGQLEVAASDPQAISAIADETVTAGQGRRGWLVFGCGIAHCTALRGALRERGVSCETIFGDTPSGERDRIIAAFKRREIRALCSMGVLTTGFNVKHVDLIALARPTKSTGLYIQIVGRGTRLFPGKLDCLVLDFGGNIARHGPVDQPRIGREPSGDGGAMPTKICEACGEENAISARECASCGAPFSIVGSKVHTEASSLEVLSSGRVGPEWITVDDVLYSRHSKAGKPDSVCVTYQCGLARHREWVCIEHVGGARQKAVAWWQKRAPGVAVPNTTAEALAQHHVLRKPGQIAVRPAGKYTEIVGVTL